MFFCLCMFFGHVNLSFCIYRYVSFYFTLLFLSLYFRKFFASSFPISFVLVFFPCKFYCSKLQIGFLLLISLGVFTPLTMLEATGRTWTSFLVKIVKIATIAIIVPIVPIFNKNVLMLDGSLQKKMIENWFVVQTKEYYLNLEALLADWFCFAIILNRYCFGFVQIVFER